MTKKKVILLEIMFNKRLFVSPVAQKINYKKFVADCFCCFV